MLHALNDQSQREIGSAALGQGKVRAGKPMRIRGRDVAANKVRITLGGKLLAVVRVKDGRFAAFTPPAPR